MLTIGSLKLESLAMLAPMAGVCDSPFKRVVRHFDTKSLLSTEIVNSDALLVGNREMLERIRLRPEESPAALQIAGHAPEPLARAAAIAQEAGADLIDINCGCPSPQLVKSGNGAALMKDPARVGALYSAVRKVTRVPMTVKMRLGWDVDSLTVFEIARIAQECGADAVWIHGRTAVQQYAGTADWDLIGQVKRSLRIPVIGNGDVFTPEDARARMARSGVDAIAIGRGAMGNPWIFRRVDHYLRTGELLPEPTLSERLAAARLQCRYLIEEIGERRGVLECRKHVTWYTKGLPDTAELKQAINAAQGAQEVYDALERYLHAQPDPDALPDPANVGQLVDAKWQRYR
ncbi:MAG TPA: tRNA dihydrouridine synthase DusB [Pantanalinema sp.]